MDKNTARMFFRSTHILHDLNAKVDVKIPLPKQKVRIEPRFPNETVMVAHFAANPGEIEPGLELFGPTGPRCPCPIDADASSDPEMDILTVDPRGALVVVECKIGRGNPAVVGQLLGYMAWVRHNLAAPGQPVRAIAIVKKASPMLKLVLKEHPEHSITVYEYTEHGKLNKLD